MSGTRGPSAQTLLAWTRVTIDAAGVLRLTLGANSAVAVDAVTRL